MPTEVKKNLINDKHSIEWLEKAEKSILESPRVTENNAIPVPY